MYDREYVAVRNMADETELNAPLFHDVTFSIIPSDDLSPAKKEDLAQLVCKNAGRYIPLREIDEQIADLSMLTHIISTHIDFPQYSAALENGIHVVKPSWIIRSAVKGRQAQTRPHSPDPSQYFHDVVLTCADLPEGDKDAIIAGVIALGGQYSAGISKLVTHVVTNTLQTEKRSIAVEKGLACKFVLPHWFDDCFRLGRLINETPYTFPDPELLHADIHARIREFPSSHISGAIEASPSGVPQPLPTSATDERKHLNALMSGQVFLGDDLQLSKHLAETLRHLIKCSGATIANDVETCTIYIGQYRDGDDYVAVSRAGKTVANLSWLYHVINRNRYTDPLNKLLHYPVPRGGIRGFEHMRISISNYTGDARIYLENLIRHCGATFTKTMKQDNTHLITAHTQSEKCEAAREWNINIVNHIWLEESYAKSAVQTLTNPRYSYFPARTNLGEVTGQTRFDVTRLEQAYYPKVRESPQKSSPRKTTPSVLVPIGDHHMNQDSPAILPEDDALTDDPEVQPTTKRPRGRPPKSTATPGVRSDEKENRSPMLQSSGRAAKSKAADRLHNQADDIALFQKEMKRKGGVVHGGRRRSSLASIDHISSPAEKKQSRKRKSDEATYDVTAEGSELSDGETQLTQAMRGKRAKTSPPSEDSEDEQSIKMLVSGDDRWLDNKARESRDRSKLWELGIALTADPGEVDIVVAPKLVRTRKFVCALAWAPKIVGIEFLNTALQKGVIDMDAPLLKDDEAEQRLGVNLAESLARAKINDRQLFRGWSIFVTKDVHGGFETYKDIVSANGGNCLLYAGRTGLTLPKRRMHAPDVALVDVAEDDGNAEEASRIYLVSGESERDIKLRKTFRRLAEKQGLQAKVVTHEWLLHAAMAQQIEWQDQWERHEDLED